MKLKTAVSLYVHKAVYSGSLLPDHTVSHHSTQ